MKQTPAIGDRVRYKGHTWTVVENRGLLNLWGGLRGSSMASNVNKKYVTPVKNKYELSF